jgi:hypothetical protein
LSSFQNGARRAGCEFAAIEYFSSAQICGGDDAIEFAAGIGRQFVPLVQAIGFDAEFRVGIPDDEIGVEILCDFSLTLFESS